MIVYTVNSFHDSVLIIMTAMSMNFIVSFIVVHTLTITLLMVSLITLSYTLYCLSLPRPLPGIPYNELAARRFLGDLPEIRKAVSYREWIWNQPRKHGSVVAQVFLRPFRGPTVIVTDLDAAVEIFDRRRKDFDRGSRNKEVVGLVAPNFHFTMNSSDPSFSAHRELIKDVMTVEFLNEVRIGISSGFLPSPYPSSRNHLKIVSNAWDR
jgi:hypothetical protein